MSGSRGSFREDQISERAGRASSHLRIHAINIYVRDQNQSLEFYLHKLGFHLVGDVRLGNGNRWVAVAPPDGSAVLSLVVPRPDSRESEFVGRQTNVVFVTEDLIGKFHEWRDRGVHFQYTPRLKRVSFERHLAAVAGPSSSASSGEHRLLEDPHSGEPNDYPPVWGGTITHFKDPDGNIFALVSYDEESRAVEEQRRALTAKAEAERRAAQELEIAKEVQMRLFPQRQPETASLDYCGMCVQAREVGGDYYDFLELGRQRLGMVVADISGKGIAAALLMANLQANLRSQCAIACEEPERFLRSVNRSFYENSSESAYATLFFAEYDDEARRLRYANCGHLAGLLLRKNGSVERLDSTCTVLGMFPIWDCLTQSHLLFAGDLLALYTDGLTEACSSAGEEFGEERLIASLRQESGRPSPAMVQAVLDRVMRHCPDEQSDDITLIIAKSR